MSFFNFHNIVGVKTTCATSRQKFFFHEEYRYHATQTLDETLPCVDLSFRELSSVDPSMVTYQHKLLAKFGYNIAIQNKKVTINVAGNNIGVPIAHHMLLHTSLRWLTARQNSVLLHSGAVAKNGKSILFSGRGGAGKTTMTSLILSKDQGWNIHADDYVFLSGERTKTYMTRAHLYRELLRWVPDINAKLTINEKIALQFFGLIRETTNEFIKWPVRLQPDRLWPHIPINDTAQPGGLLLLARENISKPKLTLNTKLEMVVQELVEMNFFEARHFISLVKAAGQYTDAWYQEWFDLERENLYAFISKVPLYTLTLPKRSTNNSNDSIISMIEELVS